MPNDLLQNFPIILYNNQIAVDITKNINMIANLVANAMVLTPYTLTESIRSDQLARQLYGDPNMEWLIFMANGITNPYDWYMDQNQFYDYLTQKYGQDYTIIQQQIAYYTNNWYDSGGLTVAAYDLLSPNTVKYYFPYYDGNGNILGYNRVKEDWTISTNHLVQFSFSNSVTVPQFTNNEIVNVIYAPNFEANGQVCFQSNSQLNIQHVSGYYNYSNTIIANQFSIYGTQSNVTLTMANSSYMTINIYDTIPATEDVYYDPITIFDDENIKNERRKYIYYLPQEYVNQVLSELKNLF